MKPSRENPIKEKQLIIHMSDTGEMDAIYKLSAKILVEKINVTTGNIQASNGVIIIKQLPNKDIQIHLNIKKEKIKLKKETE